MVRMVERNPGGRRPLLYLLHRTRTIGLRRTRASWSALETSRLSADNGYVVRFKLPAGNWHSVGVCRHDNHNVATKKLRW